MTPCTPSISHLYALEVKLAEIEQEGIAKRHERHRKNAERGRAWLQANGFEVFPEKGWLWGRVLSSFNSSLIQIIIDAKVYALALQWIFSSIDFGVLGEGIAIVHPQVRVG